MTNEQTKNSLNESVKNAHRIPKVGVPFSGQIGVNPRAQR
jgi:hypothetical protein